MQAVEVLEQNLIAERYINRTDALFGERIGFLGQLFGCWHKRLTRPFTTRRSSYRACLDCGARRHFDTETLTTSGPFYYPPVVKAEISQ